MKRVFGACVFVLCVSPFAATAQFSDWSTPVNLGSPPNSQYLDSCVAISKNGLSLFFSSNRQAPGTTNRDMYVSKRANVDDDWGSPQSIPALNTAFFDSCPALSLDEHRLYIASNRPGGCGVSEDLYVSRRHDRRDDLGWGPPVNLGCEADGYVNSPYSDNTPTFFEDESGRVVMYFASSRGTGGVSRDIYQSVMRDDDTFGPATPVAELNSPYEDQGVTVRRDGLEVIFGSNRRSGGGVISDFWVATRASTADPWSAPVLVTSLGVPAYAGGRITLSFDGTEFYFASYRPGGYGLQDLYVATRERLHGKKK